MRSDGSYSNEWEAAFDLSRLEFDSGMGHLRDVANARARWVVAVGRPAHCRFTDAVIDMQWSLHSIHPREEFALVALRDVNTDDPEAAVRLIGPGERTWY